MAGAQSSIGEIAQSMRAAGSLLTEIARDQREAPKENQNEEKEQMMDEAYESLNLVLDKAHTQASEGKGKERHAKDDEPFEKQKICEIARRVGLGYPLGQAIKKAIEAPRLGGRAGQAELLGAINYLAAAYIVMGESDEE